MTSGTAAGARTDVNPNAFDNGVMARKYGMSRDACKKPMAERLVWQQGWDEEDSRRTALAKTGGAS